MLNDYLNSQDSNYLQNLILGLSQLYECQDIFDNKYNELLQCYGVMSSLVAKYAMIELLQDDNRYSEAEQILSSISTMVDLEDDELEEYNQYCAYYFLKKSIRQSNRDWKAMSDEEEQTLKIIADSNQGRASRFAQSLLNHFRNYTYQQEELFEINEDFINENKSNLSVAFYLDGEYCYKIKDTNVIQRQMFNVYDTTWYVPTYYYVYTNSEDVEVDSVVWVIEAHIGPTDSYFLTVSDADDIELDYAQYWCCQFVPTTYWWSSDFNQWWKLTATIYVHNEEPIERIQLMKFMDCPIEGLKTEDKLTIEIYPNPVENILNISTEQLGVQITIFSIEGQEMYSEYSNETQVSIDLSNWNNGVYICRIWSDNGVRIGKIIKQ